MKPLLPPDYRPTDEEPFMNPMQHEYFRQKLLAWRSELLQESTETLQHLQEESLAEPDIAESLTPNGDATSWTVTLRDRTFSDGTPIQAADVKASFERLAKRGSASLAGVRLEIINGYTLTFEDGQYAVNIYGGNSNVADVNNKNQVSVNTANSGSRRWCSSTSFSARPRITPWNRRWISASSAAGTSMT